jgi:hypothetical protein
MTRCTTSAGWRWTHERWESSRCGQIQTGTRCGRISLKHQSLGKKAAWYKVINDILPTNERLHRICISSTDRCRHCDKQDTLQHRLTECGEGELIWTLTRQQLALILQTTPGRIPSEWLMRPHFTIWPPTRRRAVQWILANVVFFRTQMQRELTLHDLLDFLKRSKWKT